MSLRWPALFLALCLAVPVLAEDEKEEAASPEAASPAPASAAPASAASAAPAAAASPAAGDNFDAVADEYLALIKAKDFKGFVERVTPPDDPARKKPDWKKTVDETAAAYAGSPAKDQAEMLETFNALKGKTWKKSADGKTATTKVTVKGGDGKETKQPANLVLVEGKWYWKM